MPFAWAITHRPLCRITSRMIESEEELTLLLRAGVRVRERHAPFRSRHVWLLDRDIESIILRFAFIGGQHWIRRQALIATTNEGETKYDAFRSEEHTSELQSQSNLVCRLL